VNVSILSLFKCVCRIILTSYTRAKRARVHPCSRASAFSIPSSSLLLSPTPSLPVYSSRVSFSCHRHCDSHIHARGSACTRTRVRKREEEVEGASESNRVVCSANDARRRDAFLSRTRNERESFLLREFANSLLAARRGSAPLSHRAFKARQLYRAGFARREPAVGNNRFRSD